MNSKPVAAPRWIIIYDGKDITAQIAPYVLQVSYTDHLAGEPDDLDICCEDRDGRWKDAWLPGEGDTIQLRFGYEGEPLRDAGNFTIDEMEWNGAPDVISIKCVSAGITPNLRTRRSEGYEQITLRQIAMRIASRHGLTIVGTVPEITVSRETQHQETDLGFLERLAGTWGYIFNVKGTQLIWHDQAALDSAPATVIITRSGLAGRYTLRAKTSRVYKNCTVSYFNPKLKKEITHTFKANNIATGDTLRLVEHCENKSQAERIAMAALRNANGLQSEGTFPLYGNPGLVAGINVTLSGWGKLDGANYQATKALHRIDRAGGYTTELETSMNGSHNMMNLKNNKAWVK
jgi:phage protein D